VLVELELVDVLGGVIATTGFGVMTTGGLVVTFFLEGAFVTLVVVAVDIVLVAIGSARLLLAAGSVVVAPYTILVEVAISENGSTGCRTHSGSRTAIALEYVGVSPLYATIRYEYIMRP
jgi:hypothetical protein